MKRPLLHWRLLCDCTPCTFGTIWPQAVVGVLEACAGSESHALAVAQILALLAVPPTWTPHVLSLLSKLVPTLQYCKEGSINGMHTTDMCIQEAMGAQILAQSPEHISRLAIAPLREDIVAPCCSRSMRIRLSSIHFCSGLCNEAEAADLQHPLTSTSQLPVACPFTAIMPSALTCGRTPFSCVQRLPSAPAIGPSSWQQQVHQPPSHLQCSTWWQPAVHGVLATRHEAHGGLTLRKRVLHVAPDKWQGACLIVFEHLLQVNHHSLLMPASSIWHV